MRKNVRGIAVLFAASTLILAGCSSSSKDATGGAYAGPLKDTPGTINVLAWPRYSTSFITPSDLLS